MSKGRVTIIGAGGIGTATAADLTLAGHEVTLYEMPQFSENIDPIMQCGGIKLNRIGKTYFVKIHKVTTDIAEAVKGARMMLVATVGLAHKTIAELCAPYLEDGQTIIVSSGEFGSLEFSKILREERPDLHIKIAETLSQPYGARREAPGKVTISSYMRGLGLAALPARDTEQVLDEIKEFYPDFFIPGENVVEVGLSNPNLFQHPGPVLLMTGLIESTGGDVFYGKFTPSIWRVMETMFEEKKAILEALGLKELFSLKQLKDDITDPAVQKLKGPSDMQHRFVIEDCPMGLVALTSLGDFINVPTPICKAVVTLLSKISGVDYFRQGRNLKRLGISGLSIEQLKKFLNEGNP